MLRAVIEQSRKGQGSTARLLCNCDMQNSGIPARAAGRQQVLLNHLKPVSLYFRFDAADKLGNVRRLRNTDRLALAAAG